MDEFSVVMMVRYCGVEVVEKWLDGEGGVVREWIFRRGLREVVEGGIGLEERGERMSMGLESEG